jgi:hypothetical protein
MIIAILIMMAVAAALAWSVTARRPEHRPLALLLSTALAGQLAQLAWDAGVLAPLRASLGVQSPWTGWARVAGLVADALWLIEPAALVAAALVVFAGRKPWPAVTGWACAVAALAILHAIAADGSLARVLTAVQVFSVVVSALLGVVWYRRTTKPGSSEHYALGMIVTTELVSLLGAWRIGPFEHWQVSQVLYLSLFGMLIVSQGRYLWSSPQPST